MRIRSVAALLLLACAFGRVDGQTGELSGTGMGFLPDADPDIGEVVLCSGGRHWEPIPVGCVALCDGGHVVNPSCHTFDDSGNAVVQPARCQCPTAREFWDFASDACKTYAECTAPVTTAAPADSCTGGRTWNPHRPCSSKPTCLNVYTWAEDNDCQFQDRADAGYGAGCECSIMTDDGSWSSEKNIWNEEAQMCMTIDECNAALAPVGSADGSSDGSTDNSIECPGGMVINTHPECPGHVLTCLDQNPPDCFAAGGVPIYQPECQCPDEQPLWDGMRCISTDECGTAGSSECPGGQVWNPSPDCPNARTCQNYHGDYCGYVEGVVLAPGCECQGDRFWDAETQTCVGADQCDWQDPDYDPIIDPDPLCADKCPVGICDSSADAEKPECTECATCKLLNDQCADKCPVGICDSSADAEKPECTECAECHLQNTALILAARSGLCVRVA
jgi:hypothetical protein